MKKIKEIITIEVDVNQKAKALLGTWKYKYKLPAGFTIKIHGIPHALLQETFVATNTNPSNLPK